MIPKKRNKLSEILPIITLDNITINNVNHLKELLMSLKLPLDHFDSLAQEVKQRSLPLAITQYSDEKGVVISDRMKDLII